MDTPDRLIELQTAADNEHAKLRGLDGDGWHDEQRSHSDEAA
ncbi:hypothetical protein AB0B12_04765 [Streptomyces sp. NPDC044780]